MRFLNRLFGREARAADAKASDPYLAEFFGLRGAGGAVSPDAVLSNLSVAARCVALRSELLASVGLHLFRRTADGGRERADDHPLYEVLHNNFNPDLTAFEGREFLIRSLDTAGNAYARQEINGRGEVTALYPFVPSMVTPERLPSGRLRYRVTDPRGGVMVLLADEMLHVRGPTRDGVLGLSPIAISRDALSLPIAQAQAAAALMANSLRPSGILSFPERLSAEQKAAVRVGMEERYSGVEKSGKFMVMDGGAKFERIAFTPEDAEFLDSRKLSNEDVARIFNVPPTTVGILDKGTYSNVEQESQALIQNCLGPLASRMESALMRCLLTPAGRRVLYVEHDLNSLLRGDVKSRFEAYRLGREIGALSANDVRRRENEPPIPNGDTYHQPANWMPLGSQPAAAASRG